MQRLLVPSLFAALAAGCVGSPATPEGPVDTASVPIDAPAPALLTWEGYMRVGAAYDVPAHWEETSGPLRPVWSKGFELHVQEAPQAMEVTLSWTAPFARLLLMVTEPHDDEPLAVYESPATDQSPICFGIPTDALRPGVWKVMAHSELAVEAALSFEVALTAGAAAIVDEPAHVPASQFPLIVVTMQTPEPLPCASA